MFSAAETKLLRENQGEQVPIGIVGVEVLGDNVGPSSTSPRPVRKASSRYEIRSINFPHTAIAACILPSSNGFMVEIQWGEGGEVSHNGH